MVPRDAGALALRAAPGQGELQRPRGWLRGDPAAGPRRQPPLLWARGGPRGARGLQGETAARLLEVPPAPMTSIRRARGRHRGVTCSTPYALLRAPGLFASRFETSPSAACGRSRPSPLHRPTLARACRWPEPSLPAASPEESISEHHDLILCERRSCDALPPS